MATTLIQARGDQDFLRRGLNLLTAQVSEAITERGCAIVGLSGGSTPKPIYEALGKEKLDWSKVWLFLVDDRYTRADDPSSNQFLLHSTLLRNAAIPHSQVIVPDTSLPIDACVDLYDRQIRDLLKKGPPDVTTLGMGDDGHIASLFPPLSEVAFGPAAAIHTTTEKFAVFDRISATLPVLTQSRHSVFFLKGTAKKTVWEEMMASSDNERRWPAKAVAASTETAVVAQW